MFFIQVVVSRALIKTCTCGYESKNVSSIQYAYFAKLSFNGIELRGIVREQLRNFFIV